MLLARDDLEDALAAKRPDPDRVGKAYGRVFDVQRRLIVTRVRTANQVAELLSTEAEAQEESAFGATVEE
jgi:hypothetical protein